MSKRETTPLLDRSGPEPLYHQLAARIREEVRGGLPGKRIAGDDALCRQYGVSQPVVRSALKLLVDEGLIFRVRARGTFIRESTPLSGATSSGTGVAARRTLQNIGVVAPLASFFPHAEALPGIRQALAPLGSELILRESPSTTFDLNTAEPIIRDLLDKVAGIIWISPHSEELVNASPFLLGVAARVVFVNLAWLGAPLTSLIGDYERAATTITLHLLERGRRRIAFIGGPRDRLYAQQRLSGFRKAMGAAGVEILSGYEFPFSNEGTVPAPGPASMDSLSSEENVRHQQVHDELGGTIMKTMLARLPPPDAVFAANDFLAAGVADALLTANLRIPQDVALAGFDDSPVSRHLKPALTTAHLPYRELGTLAAHWLLEQLNGRQTPGLRILVPCPLLERESTGA